MRPLFVCLLFASLHASGQLLFKLDDAAATTITADALAKLPRHTAEMNDHGKHASFEGVLLHDVLEAGGVDFGKGLHGKQFTTVVKALASDGYEVVYGLAEFDPTIMDSGILLADKRDGKPLSAEEGPLRIVAPNDKRPARSVKMVREIDVDHLDK